MNYLALCQRLRQETNYANAGPTAVTGQNGDHARAASWIAQRYVELQNRHDWRWLRKPFTFNTVSGTASYASGSVTDTETANPITRFKSWEVKDRLNPARYYLASAGQGTETYLTFISWANYRALYQLGNRPSGAPAHISVGPDDKIYIGPTPNAVYTVTGEYNRSPQVLAANTDTPEMPEQYHMLIVYHAMEDYAFFEAADEVLSKATRAGRRMLRQLEGTQAPRMRMAGPLA